MSTYIYALLVLIVVLGTHMLGIDHNLYLRIPGYDIMMHMLGGFGIAFFAAALLMSYRSGRFLNRKNILILTIIAGIIWEYFEIHYEITGHPLWTKLYYIDTVKDLIDDTIGGAIAAFLVVRTKKVRQIQEISQKTYVE